MPKKITSCPYVTNALHILSRLTKVEFEVKNNHINRQVNNFPLLIKGCGQLRVDYQQIEHLQLGKVEHYEKGHWWQGRLNEKVSYNNSYRWQIVDNNTLRVSHLRRGVDHAVVLLDVHTTDGLRWQTLKPHLCGDDSYTLDMHFNGCDLQTCWTAQGPKKQQVITSCYS